MAAHIIKERKKGSWTLRSNYYSNWKKLIAIKKIKFSRQFLAVISNMKKLGTQAGTLLDIMVKTEENKFTASLMKILK